MPLLYIFESHLPTNNAEIARLSSGSPITIGTMPACILQYGGWLDPILIYAFGISQASFFKETGVLRLTIVATDACSEIGLPLIFEI